MKKTKLKPKGLPFLDYECKVGQRVQWTNLKQEYFEGVIVNWLEDAVAEVQLDDGTIAHVKC